jgi:hypothetical protein
VASAPVGLWRGRRSAAVYVTNGSIKFVLPDAAQRQEEEAARKAEEGEEERKPGRKGKRVRRDSSASDSESDSGSGSGSGSDSDSGSSGSDRRGRRRCVTQSFAVF